MVSHKWRPLEDLDAHVSTVHFQQIDSLHRQWLDFRAQREETNPDAYKAFLERVERRWAIETGIIEGLYSIDRGVTQTLIEHGLSADFIVHGSTDRDPHELINVLKDQQDAAAFVTDFIRRGRTLSTAYIRELHQILTQHQPTYTAHDQLGRVFETALDRGGFKTQPNNPTRPDGLMHEYCPPIHVDSEIGNLVQMYNRLQEQSSAYHPLLVAAWLHHRFTQIHPFQDGNGRVARALLTWHLAKEEYLPIVISRDDRPPYIECLEAADAGDLNRFVDMVVKLQRQMILDALGEPGPVPAPGLLDQVMDSVVEQIGRQNRERQAQMRSVTDVAAALQTRAIESLDLQASQICQRLSEVGSDAEHLVDHGGPGDREHWYRFEVVQTARAAQHWVNLNEPRFFVKLSVLPHGQAHVPRLVFVVSLHHIGRYLTGVMTATAFTLIGDARESGAQESDDSHGPDFMNCTVDSFTFTQQDDPEAIIPRFESWTEECLSVALRHWLEFI